MQFIDLHAQLAHMREAIDARIKTVLDHGKFIMGPEVAELEERLADYVGVNHCISCANGTDALQISLMAKGIGKGDIVFTTAFSFFATAEVIALVGATPYFTDIDPHTYNLCPDSLRKAILKAKEVGVGTPKAVIAVDLFGLPADYVRIQAICDEFGLCLIEDAAQGFGGSLNGAKAGSFGDIATTSFFPAKPLGCYGDGGAIFTDNDELAELSRSIRVHGKGQSKYENVRIGLNSRLDTIQAAVLLEKLDHFDKELEVRQAAAEFYAEHLPLQLIRPFVPTDKRVMESAWAQFTLRTPRVVDVDKLRNLLSNKDIPTMVYYPIALNKLKALSNQPSVSTPNTDDAVAHVLSLPIHGYITSVELNRVGDAVCEATASIV